MKERETLLSPSSGYGCCWSSGASSRTDTRRIHTRGEREKERGERATHTATAHETAHACARCEDRRSSAAPSCSPPRSSSLRPRLSRSHSLLSPSLSVTLSLSPSLCPFLSRSFPPLSSSPVGLPHGQRIRKRGYTRWINFIGALSLVRPSRPADDYIGIVPCFALLCSTPFCTPWHCAGVAAGAR